MRRKPLSGAVLGLWVAVLLLAAVPPILAQDSEEEELQAGLIGSGGGMLLFYDTQAPLMLQGATRKDAIPGTRPAGEVKGKACQHSLTVPIGRSASLSGAAGKGGYEKAVGGILAARPDLVGIYDVRVDVHVISILRLYTRLCVEVTAMGLGRPPAVP